MPTDERSTEAPGDSPDPRIKELEREAERWRTRAEQAERILEMSPSHVFLFDCAQQRSIYSSPALARMLGYEPEEFAKMSPEQALTLMHPDDQRDVVPENQRRLEAAPDGEQVVSEYRLRHRSGQWRWLESRCVTFSRAPDGTLERFLAAVKDITARKNLEIAMQEREEALQRANAELEKQVTERTAALRRKGALLESVIDNLPAAFYVKDLDGRFLLLNDQSAALMGLTRSDAIGKRTADIFPTELTDPWSSYERKILGGEMHQIEEVFPHEDGPHTYLSIGFPVRDEQGNVFAIGGFSTDVTEHKRAEEERTALQAQVIEAQRAAIRELSTPLIPLAQGLVVMPLVGTIDSIRAQQIMETLLSGVVDQQAQVAILDLTGLQTVDTQIVDALLRAARAARLLGAEVMLTGVKPQFAQVLVQLGVDLSGIATEGTLQSGVAAALGRQKGRR